MASVHIIGLDHFLQNLGATALTEAGKVEEERQKQQFQRIVEDAIAAGRVQLIAEEAIFNGKTLGSKLAELHGCDYRNITMPPPEREAAGIRNDYEPTTETREAAYKAFEQFMFDQVEESRAGSERILVMCGAVHREPLVRLFAARGYEVSSEDVTDKFSPVKETIDGVFLGTWKGGRWT